MAKQKTICVTGHRPNGFPWEYGNESNPQHLLYLARLREEIRTLADCGYTHFISGGAVGVDLDFAKIVLEVRRDLPITLEIAVPCPNQALKWREEDKKLYTDITKAADKTTLVSNFYTKYCMQKRNEYMVNNSDTVLAVWSGEEKGGTWNTIRYAKKISKPLKYILLQDIDKTEKESTKNR